MRILSIVTLVSPDGAYGGPVRVAVNQAAALRARGHEVTLVGGARGYPDGLPTSVLGVPARLFPARTVVPGTGFAGLAAPGMLRWLRHNRAGVDVLHIHAARDLVTLRAADWARRAGIPYVLQTHGMIDASRNPLAVPLDAIATRRALAGALRVLHLTEDERRSLLAVARGPLRLTELPNGVPTPASAPAGHGSTTSREVLYLARLSPRKRPRGFVAMARALAARHPDVTFRLVGPDEGEGPGVIEDIAAAAGVDVKWEGALAPELTGERMARAAVYVLPAIDEPYPMSVLEAMAHGLPVVVTDSCGLAPVVLASRSGLVVDGTQAALNAAVDTLVSSPELAEELGANGARVARADFTMDAIASRLEQAHLP